MTSSDIAYAGEMFGHIGAIWALVGELGPDDADQLRDGLFGLDDDVRERVVEKAQSALVDIRMWAEDAIAVLDEAGRE